ncbi:SPOR domain-containing protein [Thalassospira sp.]|uniref:SPOR domain-containing protein n=1 Tax=Thalassospira sp. TaxID=1912094 RepID=UPI003AA8538E
MAGEDHTNKPELRATPDSQNAPEAAQKDAPLPAFIYGRDGHGDGGGRGGKRPGDRQNLNARIADMDRKTLLGLVTGAGMLGLVLFFAGMLVGAGLFMDSDDGARTAQTQQPKVEMLASAEDEPANAQKPVPERVETTTGTDQDAAPEISPDSDDPVGDLIAQRSAALSEDTKENGDAVADAGDSAKQQETPEETPDQVQSAIAAPEIRDLAGATDGDNGAADASSVPEAPEAPAVPDAPAIDDAASSTSATDAADQSAPAQTASSETTASKPKASENSTATDASKPFSVQVGAFKVHENASQRAEELRGKGLEVAVVVRGKEDDAAWYYVRIGSYGSLKQARDSAAKIKADHSIDGFPVRAEPNDRVVN